MRNGISVLTAIVFGFLLAQAGAYLVGYIAAFTMPKDFAPIIWLWDVVVIQFLGFGVLAALAGYVHAKLFPGSYIMSMLLMLVACQISLLYPFSYSVYWLNVFVILASLAGGFYLARAPQDN